MQSPINIDTFAIFPSIKYEQLELNFKNQAMKIENNGHTIELGIAGESILMNRKFALNQMHFHAPSEHTIDGLYSDLEAHFVHTGADGRLAVVGVLFNVGKENLAFETILDHIPEGSSGAGFKINIDDLLPEDKAYYHYIGSLTTPPLTENVEWYVLEEKLEISQEQLIRFQKYYINNNRKTQPVNGRPINYINN
ncbi:MAG: hypothetical protein ATN31_06270 [Candidatus Epulonipiscioides saccharophilum]|nr:MAG: hypothetical protein ATN31_06270 [Epulopiscium sp. AS2M-Bin001]